MKFEGKYKTRDGHTLMVEWSETQGATSGAIKFDENGNAQNISNENRRPEYDLMELVRPGAEQ
jgi:hypothetical protein